MPQLPAQRTAQRAFSLHGASDHGGEQGPMRPKSGGSVRQKPQDESACQHERNRKEEEQVQPDRRVDEASGTTQASVRAITESITSPSLRNRQWSAMTKMSRTIAESLRTNWSHGHEHLPRFDQEDTLMEFEHIRRLHAEHEPLEARQVDV